MITNESKHPKWRVWLVLLAIFLLAFGLRCYYVSTAVVLNPVRGDATQYFAYAYNLANHGVFSKDLPDAALIHPDNYRDPGYPTFLALWMKMFGFGDTWYAAVLLIQALLGALTVAVSTQLGRHWLSLRWAGAAGVLMAVWPHNITINGYLLSETLFGFLIALGMLASASAFQRRSTRRAFFGGLTLGAAALTNAMFLPFGILLAALLAYRKLVLRRICLALALGALALPGAWAVRNALVVAPASGSSSTDRALLNLVQGSWPSFQSDWRDSVLGDEATQARARSDLHAVYAEYGVLQTSRFQGAESIGRRFSRHPLRFIRWYLVDKPVLLWGWSIEIGQGDIFIYPTKNAPFQTQSAWIALAAICHALNTVLMLLALVSLLMIWSEGGRVMTRKWPASRAVLATVTSLLVFVTLVYTTLQAEPRYSIPFRPFEILLAMTTLCAGAAWWRRRGANATKPVSNLGSHETDSG